jgi:hypothetical protein
MSFPTSTLWTLRAQCGGREYTYWLQEQVVSAKLVLQKSPQRNEMTFKKIDNISN